MDTSDKDYKKEGDREKFASDLNKSIHDDMKNVNENIRENMNHSHSGRVLTGIVIVVAGSVYLAKEMGVYFPQWLFTWPMILIGFGFFIGARHSFRAGGWIGLIAIGGVFLIDELSPGLAFHQYIWPVAIIAFGLFMILRPKRKKNDYPVPSWESLTSSDSKGSASDDFLDSVAVFGGNKKNIFSKDFKGGDIVMFFGGMELNLSQADVTGTAVLEITQFFGGTKLVVPSNWTIKSEVITVFGNFEDKRPLVKDMLETNKVLLLRGTCVFGGIDVKSYG